MAGLGEAKIRPHRVEPAPCGLLRAAVRCHRAPRRTKSVLRVICNRTQGPRHTDVVRSAAGVAPHRIAGRRRNGRDRLRAADLAGAGEPLRNDRAAGTLDRPRPRRPRRAIARSAFAGGLGVRVACCAGAGVGARRRGLRPGPGLPQPARGGLRFLRLAQTARLPLGHLSVGRTGAGRRLDLPHGDAAVESIREPGPYLSGRPSRESAAPAHSPPCRWQVWKKRMRNCGRKWRPSTSISTPASRGPPTYTTSPPTCRPTSHSSRLLGQWDLESTGGGRGNARPNRSLVLSASIPMAPDGSMPREIDALLGILRNDPLLQRDFPKIDLAGIRSARNPAAAVNRPRS